MFRTRQLRRFGALVAGASLLLALGTARPSSAADTGYVLAVSWQPAFCEAASRKPECRSQHEGRADTRQFSLHGLWPQPPEGKIGRDYCNVPAAEIDKDKSGRWRRISMERLPPDLWRRLKTAMPGTMSGLERHEWLKHGTCMAGADPERYFTASLALLDALNASTVVQLFSGRIGERVSGEEIRTAFDQAFGEGAGRRVRVACRQDGERRLILELTIGLSGELTGAPGETPDLAALIAAAKPTDPGCPGGVIDAVGFQ